MRPRGKRTHRSTSHARERHAYNPRRWFWHSKRSWRPRYSYYRRRRQVLSVKKPRKTYSVYVRGYEPLGCVGSSFDFAAPQAHWVVNNHWPSAFFSNLLDDKDAKYSDFVGGWGEATWTLDGILKRIRKGWAEISMNIDSFIYCKLVSITIYGIPLRDHEWVLTGQTHFSTDIKDYQNIKYWIHPLHLMLTPGRLYVPTYIKKQKTFWRRRFKPPPSMANEWFDKHYFDIVNLFKYQWSIVELQNPVGYPEDAENYKDIVDNSTWFKKETNSKWKNTCFDKQWTEPGNTDLWSLLAKDFFKNVWTTLKQKMFNQKTKASPFFPPFYTKKSYECPGFFYKIKFLFGGHSFQVQDPGDVTEVQKPAPCTQLNCSADINSSDISDGGTISNSAFRRIVGADNEDRMEDTEETTQETEEEEECNSIYSCIRRYIEKIQRNGEGTGL